MKNIFISMIGLEERGLGFFKKAWDFKLDEYLLFTNREFANDKRVAHIREQIINNFLQTQQLQFLEASYDNPFEIVRSFNQYVSNSALDIGSCNFFLDISNLNRQNLLVLLWLLRKKYRVKSLDIFYTVPEKYNYEISKGAKGYANIPFFGGSFSKGKAKLLILLVGYETDRPLYLFNTLEPSRVILAEGDEPMDVSFLAQNMEIVRTLGSKIRNVDVEKVSAKDPHKAAQQLSSIFIKNKDDYNIVASSLNTKVQAVGLYLACETNPEVQIVYSFPDIFGEWLSTGIKQTLTFHLQQ